MSPVVSSEDVNTTCKSYFSFGKSVKVAGMSKQIDLMRNNDCQERSNLYYVIDIGCSFNKSVKEKIFFLNARAQMYHLNCNFQTKFNMKLI